MADTWDNLIEAAARRHNVDPRLLKALMLTESNGNPNAVGPPTNWGRAEGLMQIIPPTARALAVNPRDPAQAIDGAARLLAQNLDRYGTPELAIRAYHGGTDTRNWGPQNDEHLRRVIGHYGRLSQVQADPPAAGQPPTITPGEAREFLGAGATPGASGASADVPVEEFLRGDAGNPETRATVPQASTSRWDRFSSGVTRGMRDVLDPPAEFLAGLAERTGITEGVRNSAFGRFLEQDLGVPVRTQDAEAAVNREERQRFERDYGDSGYATGGRMVGQIGAVVPMMSPLGAAARGFAVGSGSPLLATMTGVSGATTGNALLNAGARTVGGAASGATGAYLTADPDKPMGQQLATGAALGGAMSGVVAPAVAAGTRGVREFFSPPVSPERALLAQRMGQLGIPVYGPQMTNSPFTRRVYASTEAFPFSGQPERLADQAMQVTRAVARTFGEDTPTITQTTIQNARTRIGNIMDDVASRTNLVPDAQVRQELQAISKLATETLEGPKAALITRYIEDLLDKMNNASGGVIPGRLYQTWTRHMSPLKVFQESNDGAQRMFGDAIRSSLDDLLVRSSPPNELARLRDARAQWKAMMTIAPLVNRSPDGVLNPQQLFSAIRTNYDTFKNGGGTGNALGDIALGANAFMGRVFGSDTAFNQQILRYMQQLEGLGPLALMTHDPMLGAMGLGTAAGLSTGARLTASGLSSDWYRNRLINNALNPNARPGLASRFGTATAVPAAVAAGNAAQNAADDEELQVIVEAPAIR